MVGGGISIQEKESRNKGKLRADPSLTDLNNPSPSSNMAPNYEAFSEEKPMTNLNLCDECRARTYSSQEELNLDEFHDVGWIGITESQLEELVLTNLDAIYKSAIKRITSHGYAEGVAKNVVMQFGRCYGRKDPISNIVDSTLAFLGCGHQVDSSLRESSSEELQKLEKRVLEDMVSMLREVRPSLSMGDAMWYLLICDMNVLHAYAMGGKPLNAQGNVESPGGVTFPQMKPESNSNSSLVVPEFNVSGPDNPIPYLPYPSFGTKLPNVAGTSNLYSGRFTASSSVNDQVPNLGLGKEYPVSTSDYVVVESSSQTILQSSLLEEKLTNSRKGHAGGSKRDCILQQKTSHSEKSCQGHGPKDILRAIRTTDSNNLVSDNKCKSIPDINSVSVKSSSRKSNKTAGTDMGPADATHNVSFSVVPSASSLSCMETLDSTSTSPTADAELSLSLPTKSSNAILKPNCSVEAPNCSDYTGILSDKKWGESVPKDMEDVIQLNLGLMVLHAQLQEWTEWTRHKVMQAACRLSKDKAELQALRQEKEEVTHLQKERQTLKENTAKKLREMENALSKVTDEVEKANATVCRLETENSELRQELEDSKLRAAESAANCQEVTLREINTLKKLQPLERQKALFHQDLAIEKHKLSQLQQQLKQAKEYHGQVESKWKQEKKVKEEALVLAESERKDREQIEVSAKLEEDTIRSKGECDMQRYKSDILSLERQIANLRLTVDSSKIAALRWGLDNIPQLSFKLLDFQESGNQDVPRDRECVMCLTEEISVVFLPCAHQVVCTKCNEMHEKQGMKDCPSCRTLIQQRIRIRTADAGHLADL